MTVASGGLLAGAFALPVLPAGAVTPTPVSQDFSGYSTGTVVHADALQAGAQGPQVANVEAAFSGSSVASKGTDTVPATGPQAKAGQIVNEMGQVVQPNLPDTKDSPKLAGSNSYARGSGLEVGLANNVPNPGGQIPLNKVAVSAPPAATDTAEIGPVKGSPLAFASVLRGTAAADFNKDSCIIGKPISQGEGYAADAQVLETGKTNPNGTLGAPLLATDNTATSPAVVDSTSAEFFSPPVDAKGKALPASGLGLTSQTTQIVAPVTLFKGTPNQLTIEVAGVWRLKAEAGGVNGSAHVTYAPVGNVSPSTPVVTILTGTGAKVTKQVEITLQQILGDKGLTIPASPLANISIGAAPHAIGDPSKPAVESADGTSASGAVDIVSVQLLQPGGGVHVADVRVGHMEARAHVQKNGISCPIDVTKTANPSTVAAGNDFTYTITVNNHFDCTLTKVKVLDTITPSDGVDFAVTSPSDAPAHGPVTFADIGPIKPGASKQVTIGVHIPATSGEGTLTDHVNVTAACAAGAANGGTTVVTGSTQTIVPTVNVAGDVTITTPTIGPPNGPVNAGAQGPPTKVLPRTGGSPLLPLAATGLLGFGAFALRRLRRS